MQGAWIQSLAGELRSHMARGMASRQKQNENLNTLRNHHLVLHMREVRSGQGNVLTHSRSVMDPGEDWKFQDSVWGLCHFRTVTPQRCTPLSSLCVLFVGFLPQLVPLTRSWWAAGTHWMSSVCYYVEGGSSAEGLWRISDLVNTRWAGWGRGEATHSFLHWESLAMETSQPG